MLTLCQKGTPFHRGSEMTDTEQCRDLVLEKEFGLLTMLKMAIFRSESDTIWALSSENHKRLATTKPIVSILDVGAISTLEMRSSELALTMATAIDATI